MTELLFVGTMVYASYRDIKVRLVETPVYIALGAIGLMQLNMQSITGLLLAFLPLLLVGLCTDLGGGDIKFAAMCGFVLGGTTVLPALLIGLLAACILVPTYRAITKAEQGASFPLVPFLSFGFTVAIFF